MADIAFLFPGQGSQFAGKGQQLAAEFPEAARVFEEADDTLGFALSRICFGGPEEDLKKTEITQPALFTVSIAALRVLAAQGVAPDWVAGHSLGEYGRDRTASQARAIYAGGRSAECGRNGRDFKAAGGQAGRSAG